MVARDFPPFEKTHARISLGTMEEMQKAVHGVRRSAREEVDGCGVESTFEVTTFEVAGARVLRPSELHVCSSSAGSAIIRRTFAFKHNWRQRCREDSDVPRRRSPRSRSALVWMTARPSGQAAGLPSTKKGDWTHYTADMRGTKYSPLDQINGDELQQARGRVAVQDRQPRHATRVQARRHAARDQRRALHDRRHAPIGRRARRPDRRVDLGAQLPRRQPRRDRAAPALGPRRVVLDRRQGRRAHPLRHHRLSPDRAQREERRDDSRRSARTASST